jgi:hypothetical protein
MLLPGAGRPNEIDYGSVRRDYVRIHRCGFDRIVGAGAGDVYHHGRAYSRTAGDRRGGHPGGRHWRTKSRIIWKIVRFVISLPRLAVAVHEEIAPARMAMHGIPVRFIRSLSLDCQIIVHRRCRVRVRR